MPTNITLSSVFGASPFDVYVCDTGFTACIYVDTVNFGDIPYTFDIPPIYSTLLPTPTHLTKFHFSSSL